MQIDEKAAVIAEAQKQFAKRFENRSTYGLWILWGHLSPLHQLREAGFDDKSEGTYALLGTTKAEFDQAIAPLVEKWTRNYYDWSMAPEKAGQYAIQCLGQLQSILIVAGYNLESDEPYKIFGTTRAEFEQHEILQNLISARQSFLSIEKEGYIPDACLFNMKQELRRAGLNLTRDETYEAIGTTKAEIIRLDKKYPSTTDLSPFNFPSLEA